MYAHCLAWASVTASLGELAFSEIASKPFELSAAINCCRIESVDPLVFVLLLKSTTPTRTRPAALVRPEEFEDSLPAFDCSCCRAVAMMSAIEGAAYISCWLLASA